MQISSSTFCHVYGKFFYALCLNESESESCSVVPNSLGPQGLYRLWTTWGQNTGVGSLLQRIFPTQGWNPGLLHAGGFLPAEPQGKPKNTGVGSLSLLQRIFPTQGSNTDLLHAGGFLPAEPQWKCKNTVVGSLSLLQNIFWTQELNQGLLHCRQILYQLSYQGSLLCFSTLPIKAFFISRINMAE